MSWDFFDSIYCISLKDRKDRQASANEQFDKVGLSSKVQFYLTSKHPNNSERGIYESHIRCLQKGIEEDAQTILVFEDDIIFERFSFNMLKDIVYFMHKENQWNIFFLGCMVNNIQKTEYPSVVKIKYRCSAHAYVVNRSFAEVIVKHSWKNIAFDDFLREMNNDNAYAVSPFFAFQSSSATDNKSTLQLARFRELCGGIKLIQKANEFYFLHKHSIWLVHLIIIILIIMLLILL